MQIASTVVYEDVQHEIFIYMNNLYEFNGYTYVPYVNHNIFGQVHL